ncbi:MAG: acyltransferase [Lachnospiraceae bacterium]|nr:acyltransferase [Frisingicoccus sp.]MDY5868822.1 acyltransferase [Lachnospiraceae bacterium]
MKKYNYIDFVKTITMFLVIVAHCTLFFSGNEFWFIKAEQESIVLRWISKFVVLSVVPIFTFASGFLLQLSLQKNKGSIVDLIRKKAVHLCIPYFIYGILWLVPTYTFFDIPSFGRDKGASLIDGYKAMALGQFSDVAWFLLMLFWVTLIWILLKELLKKENLIYGAMVSAVLYFVVHFYLGQIDYYKISQIDIYIIVFFVGAAFFYVSDIVYNTVPEWLLIVGSLVGMIPCVFLAQLSTERYILECILKIVIPVLFLTFSMGLCRTNVIVKLEETAVYNWLRKNSLYIYLLQAPGVYIVFGIIYPIIGSNALLCFLLLFILTTLIDVILTLIYVFIKGKILHVFALN